MRPTQEIDDPTWQDVKDRDKELAYWKKIAAYLTECNAATLESEGPRKSTSKSDRKRYQDICRISSDALQGEFDRHCTNHIDVDVQVKHAIERCDRALSED